ncbi:MAG: H-NS family nucleoid-associated regulatory protein [Xanthobacteraceae bacterium]
MAKKSFSANAASLVRNFGRLTLDAQALVLSELSQLYQGARNQRINVLKSEIRELSATTKKKAAARKKAVAKVGKKAARKVAAKYRSTKDKTMTWSGRGLMPRWMKAEMKELKVKADHFLIKGK